MKHIIKSTFALVLLGAYTTPTLATKHLDNSLINGLSVQLGEGYSSEEERPLGIKCLKDITPEPSGSGSTVIEMGDAKSSEQIQKDLHISLSVEGKYGMYSADVKSNFMRQTQDDSYAETFYYDEMVKQPPISYVKLGIGNSILNDIGQAALQISPQQFYLTCGDQFVYSERLGANLVVAVKLKFHNHSDKMRFDAAAEGSAGSIFNISAKMDMGRSSIDNRGTIEVSAFQEGGDATHLAGIFSQSAKGRVYMTSCSLANPEACKNAISGIITYAQTDFAKQLSKPDESAVVVDQTTHFYHEKKIKYKGEVIAPQQLPDDVNKARTNLDHMYKIISRDAELTDQLLASPLASRYIADTHQKLEKLSRVLHQDTAILSDPQSGAVGCYLHPDRCIKISNNLISKLDGDPAKGGMPDVSLLDEFNRAYMTDDGQCGISPMGNAHVSAAKCDYEPLGHNVYMAVIQTTDGRTAYHGPIYISPTNDDSTLYYVSTGADWADVYEPWTKTTHPQDAPVYPETLHKQGIYYVGNVGARNSLPIAIRRIDNLFESNN